MIIDHVHCTCCYMKHLRTLANALSALFNLLGRLLFKIHILLFTSVLFINLIEQSILGINTDLLASKSCICDDLFKTMGVRSYMNTTRII